jgi:hypothetical protein
MAIEWQKIETAPYVNGREMGGETMRMIGLQMEGRTLFYGQSYD